MFQNSKQFNEKYHNLLPKKNGFYPDKVLSFVLVFHLKRLINSFVLKLKIEEKPFVDALSRENKLTDVSHYKIRITYLLDCFRLLMISVLFLLKLQFHKD